MAEEREAHRGMTRVPVDLLEHPHHAQPIVRTHPGTGRKALYVNRLMSLSVEGLDADESDLLLEALSTVALNDPVFRKMLPPGFAFDDATPGALAKACEAAMTMRVTGGAPWPALVARGMAVDFDWTRGSAPRYAALYDRAIKIRRGSHPRAEAPTAGRATG